MKLAEYLEDLDPKLATDLERALGAVREEFEGKIASTVQEAVSAAQERAAIEAQKTARESTPPAASAAMALDAADELRLAALEIDTATSQAEILETLSRGLLRFSSRVAIFVNRGQEVHGWSASGFGGADAGIKEVSLGTELPFPIGSRLSAGTVALSADDCASICDAIGAEHPSMGLLLPFVLGDQVVGTVYCDRREDDSFSVSALQLLTYIAGQTLETLPVRKRESTATLALARGSTTAAAVAEPSTASEPAAESAPVEARPQAEPEPVESMPQAEPEPVTDDFEPTPESAENSLPEAPVAAQPEPPPPAVPRLEQPPPSFSEPALGALGPVDEESTRPGTLEPAPMPQAPPAPAAQPASGGADESLGASVEPAISLSSTQVAPPSDLQGPGWAFTAGGEANDANSESEHEEAQRLARLLVTEIKLYNEEAVEQGRRDGDVYSRLQEDIDRSRQIFEDRIDPGVRGENDYFKQALIRILAGGDPTLLGI